MARCLHCNAKNPNDYKFCSNCGEKNMSQKATSTYHFVVMGSGGVGKSAITIRYVSRHFEAKYDPTIEDRYQKIIDYRGVVCILEILDTAGQEAFSAMRELYMKNGEGFVLVYSITSQRSFEDLVPIREGIMRHKNDGKVPIVLVGNKCDLAKKREVETKEAREVAKEHGFYFVESSARYDINISVIFTSLIDQIWSQSGGPPIQRKKAKCRLI